MSSSMIAVRSRVGYSAATGLRAKHFFPGQKSERWERNMLKKALRRFLKEKPSHEEYGQLVAELTTDGPRGSAALAAAMIDVDLKNLSLGKMVELKRGEEEAFFGGTGPLADAAQCHGSIMLSRIAITTA